MQGRRFNIRREWGFWATVFAVLCISPSLTHAAPTITVISPNGGETYYGGSTLTIEWAYTETPGTTLKIQLLKGNAIKRTVRATYS